MSHSSKINDSGLLDHWPELPPKSLDRGFLFLDLQAKGRSVEDIIRYYKVTSSQIYDCVKILTQSQDEWMQFHAGDVVQQMITESKMTVGLLESIPGGKIYSITAYLHLKDCIKQFGFDYDASILAKKLIKTYY